jgi:aryl-alcohol dehydrogenase-like predicted oxidoreductase
MQLNLFGNSGLALAEIGLGTRSFGDSMDQADCGRVLDCYEDAGGNLIDTATSYADGRSEQILGRLLAGPRRDRFVLSTKFGKRRIEADANSAGASRRNLRSSLDESLKRLQSDHVDILWLHAWHPGLPWEELLRGVRDEVARGRVLHFGISNAPAWWIARLHTAAEERRWQPLVGIQVEYSIGCREAEGELLPMATELSLGVLAWSPLQRGRVVRPPAAGSSTIDAATHRRAERTHQALREVSRATGMSMAAVAIQWLIRKNVTPLAGVRTAAHLAELSGIGSRFTEQHEALLDDVSATEKSALQKLLGEVRGRVDPMAHIPPSAQ